MSLDVTLYTPGRKRTPRGSGIFVRQDGRTIEISRDDYARIHPGREPVVVKPEETEDLWSANLTHNLGDMAREAGIYQALWHPEELGFTQGSQLVEVLSEGLARLLADPVRFQALNPANNWGSYATLVEFVREYRDAARACPTALIRVSR